MEKVVKFYTNIDNSTNELLDIVKLFFADCEITAIEESADIIHKVYIDSQSNGEILYNACSFNQNTNIMDFFENLSNSYQKENSVKVELTEKMGELINALYSEIDYSQLYSFSGSQKLSFLISQYDFSQSQAFEVLRQEGLIRKKLIKRYAKLSIYELIKNATKKEMPWGALTGVRPTKLAYDIMSKEKEDYKQAFKSIYDVSVSKISLIEDILNEQKGIRVIDDSAIDLYIGIPFCVTRCSYCSFSAGELKDFLDVVDKYTDCLSQEITASLDIIKRGNYQLGSIYIGGGTPTTLTPQQFEKIFKALKGVKVNEFTVEAGRPDTISQAHLELFKENGVNRVSVNPQTFCNDTLIRVNRHHTAEDIRNKFESVRKMGFTINMDLIAGLPKESYQDFCHSVISAVELSPENLTVHTLAMKNGSQLKIENYVQEEENIVREMVDFAYQTITNNHYKPYYMYRQKYVCANLENVGYTKQGFASHYNIHMMEDVTSVIACGVHSISKLITGDRVKRQADIRDIRLYIDLIDKQIKDKYELFIK